MKTFLVLLILTISVYAQDRTMNLRGYDVELGMNMTQVWNILKKGFNVVEESDGTFYISDKRNEPVGIIVFENEKAVKIIRDWGTKTKSNVGQVFKTLWNIVKQYEKDLDDCKIVPLETYTEKGSKFSMLIFISDNRYLEITIQHTVTILEVLEEPSI